MINPRDQAGELQLNYEVDEIVTVSEEAICRTLTFLLSRLKIVVEPTGKLATALLEDIVITPKKRIGVIISGGNLDLQQISVLLK